MVKKMAHKLTATQAAALAELERTTTIRDRFAVVVEALNRANRTDTLQFDDALLVAKASDLVAIARDARYKR